MFAQGELEVKSPNVQYTPSEIVAKYEYQTSEVTVKDGKIEVVPETKSFTFTTKRQVPKLGVMIVGWGG